MIQEYYMCGSILDTHKVFKIDISFVQRQSAPTAILNTGPNFFNGIILNMIMPTIYQLAHRSSCSQAHTLPPSSFDRPHLTLSTDNETLILRWTTIPLSMFYASIFQADFKLPMRCNWCFV